MRRKDFIDINGKTFCSEFPDMQACNFKAFIFKIYVMNRNPIFFSFGIPVLIFNEQPFAFMDWAEDVSCDGGHNDMFLELSFYFIYTAGA